MQFDAKYISKKWSLEGWKETTVEVDEITGKIAFPHIDKNGIRNLRILSEFYDADCNGLELTARDLSLLLQKPIVIKGISILISDEIKNSKNGTEVKFAINDISKHKSLLIVDALSITSRKKYCDGTTPFMKIVDEKLVIRKEMNTNLSLYFNNYGFTDLGFGNSELEDVLNDFIKEKYPPVVKPKIELVEFSKSKKDNIHCLYLKLNKRGYSIMHDDIQSDENENEIITLGFGTCCSDEVISVVEIDVTRIKENFEYMNYDIRLNKDEVYVYFYEYPYNNDEIESVELINVDSVVKTII